MINKIVGSVKEKLFDSGKKELFNEDVNQIKEEVDSLIDFNDYKDDIESFMYIDKASNKYDKKNKRLDLTKFVFGVLKPMLKNHFIDFISHVEFKKMILKIYGLDSTKGEYKISFNSEEGKESFVLINISDNRRYSGFTSKEVDGFIFNTLRLKDNEEIAHFINKVIYGIDESFEKFTGKFFKQFIYSHILKEVTKLLYKNNDINKLFLGGNNGAIDKELFVKAMAGKIYRDNFEYIHKVAGHKLMSDIPKLVLDELLSNHSIDLKDEINYHFDNIISFLSGFDSSKQSILEIEDEFKNDILINFQDKIKLYFQKFDDTNIDSELLKGTISFLIENNNLSLNIKELSDVIFSLLDDNIDDLIKLFGKYNGEIIEENGKKFVYSRFNIRDCKDLKGKYSVEKIFLGIKDIVDEINVLENEIKNIESILEKQNITNYSYNSNIGDKEKKLLEYDDIIDNLVVRKKEIEKKIELIKNQNILDKFLDKGVDLDKLKKDYNGIYEQLLKITKKRENLEASIIGAKARVLELNNGNKDIKRKLDDLRLILNNKKIVLERIREDFMRNILFGREEIK